MILLPLPYLVDGKYTIYPPSVYLCLLLMGLVPQLIGHTSFNWAIGRISPTLVTLAVLFEPIGSSILGFLLFKEVPSLAVVLGGVVILSGVAVAVLGSRTVPPQG